MFNTWTLVFLGLAPILIAVAAWQARRPAAWINIVALDRQTPDNE
jgi:hypothetical protein